MTTTTANEIKVNIAPYGADKLLFAWATDKEATFGFFDPNGKSLSTPETLPVKFGPLDDFKDFPNVDVGWAYAWTDLTRLKILRIAYCKEG